eukprot:Sspe_Gene.106601::Locus_84670_Transcript_1_1_Confidence_1.000_Length_864::g.106601::m.106601
MSMRGGKPRAAPSAGGRGRGRPVVPHVPLPTSPLSNVTSPLDGSEEEDEERGLTSLPTFRKEEGAEHPFSNLPSRKGSHDLEKLSESSSAISEVISPQPTPALNPVSQRPEARDMPGGRKTSPRGVLSPPSTTFSGEQSLESDEVEGLGSTIRGVTTSREKDLDELRKETDRPRRRFDLSRIMNSGGSVANTPATPMIGTPAPSTLSTSTTGGKLWDVLRNAISPKTDALQAGGEEGENSARLASRRRRSSADRT